MYLILKYLPLSKTIKFSDFFPLLKWAFYLFMGIGILTLICRIASESGMHSGFFIYCIHFFIHTFYRFLYSWLLRLVLLSLSPSPCFVCFFSAETTKLTFFVIQLKILSHEQKWTNSKQQYQKKR